MMRASSPPFGLHPGALSSAFDWTGCMCVTKGITAVFLGGLFHLVLCDRTLARNEELRCAWLWAEVQEFYRRSGTTDKLHNLTVRMIKPKRGSIELSVGAVPRWGRLSHLHCSWWSPGRMMVLTSRVLVPRRPWSSWPCVIDSWAQSKQLLRQALYWTMLWDSSSFSRTSMPSPPRDGNCAPKLHMFLELAAEGSNPSSSWNYREESLGGFSGQAGTCEGLASLALWPWALPCWPNFVARRHCQSCCLLIEVWIQSMLVAQKKESPTSL